MKRDRFPLGIATGEDFCNRVEERQHLTSNITAGRHTLLLAPRRYGKTSLTLKVLEDVMAGDSKTASVAADFLVAHDISSVQATLLDAVGRITADVLPLHTRAIQTLGRFFSSLKPEVVVSESGAKVRFTPGTGGTQSVMEALEGLDKIAAEKEVRAVVVMDEFQQIGTLSEGKIIEAAIRHAVERARHTSYVFSGSNRHTLSRAFDDDTRPLFHVCDQLVVPRIDADDYISFLQTAAKEAWGKPMAVEAIDAILTATARHPYYVNLLCSRLWRRPAPPTPVPIEEEWTAYVMQEPSWHASEVSQLSPNQRAVLAALAAEPTSKPTSREFLSRVRLANASCAQAVETLTQRDLVFRDETGFFRILDPALERYLASIAS